MAAATPLPEHGVIIVIDQNGVILARHPDQLGLAGEKIRNPHTLQALLSGKAGVFQSLAPEGVERLLAYESVGENSDGKIPLRVAVSIPVNVIYADANRALVRNLIGIVVATLFLLIGAWYGAERLVLRNIKLLLDAANRVRSGDLGARTGLRGKDEELNQVGHAFDEMAHALQHRDAELKQAMRALHAQAITDPLTSLFNRRYVLQLLPRELKRAKRSGSTLAAIMIDLDHFKRVNDTFGHEAGDQVLMSLGTLLKDNSRGGDTACRYGGEEFLIILPETSLEGTLSKANDIISAVKHLDLKYHGKPLGQIRASLGVALFPDHADDADSLLRAADEAMYEAKGRGRDRIVVSAAEPASR
jgi:diguanylate cyclase (GGDEF)-like protein